MKVKLIRCMGQILLLFSLITNAFASGPYEGASACKESVNQPDIDIDGLFEVDKDCTTVFVLPPKHGNAILASYTLTGMSDLCDSYTDMKMTETKIIKLVKDLNLKLVDEIITIHERERTKERIKDANEYLVFIEDRLDKSSSMVGLRAKMYFETDWDKLVKAYKEVNNGMIVKRVPVVASIFNITTEGGDEFSSMGDDLKYDGVYSLDIPGVRVGSAERLFEYIGMVDPSDNSFLFGNSLTGTLLLNHHGMCSIKKYFERDNRDISLDEINAALAAENIDSFMVANLAVWYPVHLQKKYTVKVNVKNVSNTVTDFIKTKNTFSTKEFVDEIEKGIQDQNIKIDIISEHVGDNIRGEIEDLRTRITDDIVFKMLSFVATPVNGTRQLVKLDVPSDPHIYVTQNRRLCRTKKKLFSRSTHCWTENYQVKRKVEGSAHAHVERLRSYVASYNEDTRLFSTILRSTTLGFTRKQR